MAVSRSSQSHECDSHLICRHNDSNTFCVINNCYPNKRYFNVQQNVYTDSHLVTYKHFSVYVYTRGSMYGAYSGYVTSLHDTIPSHMRCGGNVPEVLLSKSNGTQYCLVNIETKTTVITPGNKTKYAESKWYSLGLNIMKKRCNQSLKCVGCIRKSTTTSQKAKLKKVIFLTKATFFLFLLQFFITLLIRE